MAIQRAVITIEIEKGENKYVFQMPYGSPLGEAYDSAVEVLKELVEMSKVASERVQRKEETPVEAPKE